MYDPYSQIGRFGPFTLWHKDPETDGTDDSCGWFQRQRHMNQDLSNGIRQEFEFNFKHNYWFTEDGMPIFSTQGIVLNMYGAAAWKIFYPNRKKYDRFFRKHIYDILKFAENPTDSLHTAVTNEYRYRMIEHDRTKVESRQERISGFASVVYSDIMRKLRPWYRHPRWHVHHWRISFNIYSAWNFGQWLWRVYGAKKHNVATNVDQNLRDTV